MLPFENKNDIINISKTVFELITPPKKPEKEKKKDPKDKEKKKIDLNNLIKTMKDKDHHKGEDIKPYGPIPEKQVIQPAGSNYE